jgi:hypothetical protein
MRHNQLPRDLNAKIKQTHTSLIHGKLISSKGLHRQQRQQQKHSAHFHSPEKLIKLQRAFHSTDLNRQNEQQRAQQNSLNIFLSHLPNHHSAHFMKEHRHTHKNAVKRFSIEHLIMMIFFYFQ